MKELGKIKVWVLAPLVEQDDASIDYYCDFSQSIEEYRQVFTELNLPWQWHPVTIQNYQQQIDLIVQERDAHQYLPIVLNLCDGDDINGSPGISVLQYLQRHQLIFTGADEYFYRVTTSKIPMKIAFDQAGVSTPKWLAITHPEQDLTDIFEKLGSPIIVKPAVSGGSMGVGTKNVVDNSAALQKIVQQMFQGYRGWNLSVDGLIAESFVMGPEFTSFITGSSNDLAHCQVFTPVERVFHPSLAEKEKFLSFDRLWEIYEEELPMPNEENFYEYTAPSPNLHDALKQISKEAYLATKGMGYTRVDIRMDELTKQLYVLEVNAQCGLSKDENYTSIGAILRMSNTSFTHIIKLIIEDAIRRSH